MYFCPHPRRYPRNGQGRGPRKKVNPRRNPPLIPPQPPPQIVQIMRQPQLVTAIPTLLEEVEEWEVNVIQSKDKGKEKMKEPEIMSIEKERVTKEPIQMTMDKA